MRERKKKTKEGMENHLNVKLSWIPFSGHGTEGNEARVA